MTRRDLKFLFVIAGLVVVVGLAIGYIAGTLSRSEAPRTTEPGAAGQGWHPAEAVTDGYPGYQELYVNDYADLLDPAAEGRIRGKLKSLFRSTDIEMTVLTIDSMARYGHAGAIEPFATGLFNQWGIGDAKRNDGVLVLVAADDRKMRIELGAGFSRSWDARMQRVIDTGFLPHFRNDAYQTGIETGVDATIFELTGALPEHQDLGTVQRGWAWIWYKMRAIGDWIWAGLLVPAVGGWLGLRRYLRNRPRSCSACGTMMERLDEAADDDFLDDGQQTEEFVKSVDYDVWSCGSCGHMDIHGYKSWFSGHGNCPQCAYRTMKTETTVLVSATTSSTGRKRIDYDCRHCGYHNQVFRVIPRKTKSSGSGGGSFGGGSSSGGGASGSW
jgi:uncharacterized protein